MHNIRCYSMNNKNKESSILDLLSYLYNNKKYFKHYQSTFFCTNKTPQHANFRAPLQKEDNFCHCFYIYHFINLNDH